MMAAIDPHERWKPHSSRPLSVAPLGATDVTASVGAGIAHELLTGLALHRG